MAKMPSSFICFCIHSCFYYWFEIKMTTEQSDKNGADNRFYENTTAAAVAVACMTVMCSICIDQVDGSNYVQCVELDVFFFQNRRKSVFNIINKLKHWMLCLKWAQRKSQE